MHNQCCFDHLLVRYISAHNHFPPLTTHEVEVTLHFLVVLVLIWSIKDQKMNASSWSSATNTLQGTIWPTIARPKDIQFRNFFCYQNQSTQAFSNETIAVGLTRPMQYLLLNNEYTIVEGLVVDPIDGGVGIRNHTVPVGLELGKKIFSGFNQKSYVRQTTSLSIFHLAKIMSINTTLPTWEVWEVCLE